MTIFTKNGENRDFPKFGGGGVGAKRIRSGQYSRVKPNSAKKIRLALAVFRYDSPIARYRLPTPNSAISGTAGRIRIETEQTPVRGF